MSWRQRILDASVGVNRSVFEMNRRGHPMSSPLYKEQPDLNYIKNEVRAAIEDLHEADKELTELTTGQKQIDFKS